MFKNTFITMLGIAIHCTLFAGQIENRIEAEKFDRSKGVGIKEISGGKAVNNFSEGKWIQFNEMNMSGITSITFRAASGSTGSTVKLEVRMDSDKGKVLGTIDVPVQGWSKFQEITMPIASASGKNNLVLVSAKSGILLDWIQLNTK